jgi:hypothetical protein
VGGRGTAYSSNRDTAAIQIKLDELIGALQAARNLRLDGADSQEDERQDGGRKTCVRGRRTSVPRYRDRGVTDSRSFDTQQEVGK